MASSSSSCHAGSMRKASVSPTRIVEFVCIVRLVETHTPAASSCITICGPDAGAVPRTPAPPAAHGDQPSDSFSGVRTRGGPCGSYEPPSFTQSEISAASSGETGLGFLRRNHEPTVSLIFDMLAP